MSSLAFKTHMLRSDDKHSPLEANMVGGTVLDVCLMQLYGFLQLSVTSVCISAACLRMVQDRLRQR